MTYEGDLDWPDEWLSREDLITNMNMSSGESHYILLPREKDLVFFYFDVETTGSKRNYDRSIQIALVVRNHKKEILEEKSWLINPEGVDSTPKAMATHNTPKSKLKDKPPFSVVGREIVAFLAKHLAKGIEEFVKVQAATMVGVGTVEGCLELHELVKIDTVLRQAGGSLRGAHEGQQHTSKRATGRRHAS